MHPLGNLLSVSVLQYGKYNTKRIGQWEHRWKKGRKNTTHMTKIGQNKLKEVKQRNICFNFYYFYQI